MKNPSRLALLFFTAVALLHASTEARTLTAADGRTIDAEVVGFDGTDKVKIKRADTGQTFTLPISTFGEADQAALGAEAAEAAKKVAVLPAGAVVLELSRVRLDSRREKQDITFNDGTVRKGGLTITEEDWGYSISLRNTINRPIEGLRGEYILFVKVDNSADPTSRGDGRLKRNKGELTFDPVPQAGRISTHTKPITARKRELASGIVWSGSGDNKTRDTLHGIWLRVYQGDTLVLESASPGTLSTTETWSGEARR